LERESNAGLIARVTKTTSHVLHGEDISTESVAQRISWASSRQTTRPEDFAYCLLGLFDINMPLSYGEGSEKVFVLLQEAIMQTLDGQTIFAWTHGLDEGVEEHRPSRSRNLLYPETGLM
jgi:hypothetical protein